ncbi:helix-turn-helix transcriptional regulator [Streptomyces sodiiphilus]|uniref:helix-turn-helix domain-containing protein n=1 Tax=Streptomyces sodiiphilus TaxID=226217 RepID=UPI0031DE5D88
MLDTNHDDERLTARVLIARQLRKLREEAGLSLRKLGSEIHFQHSYISDVESGRKLPSEEMARALDERFSPTIPFTDLLEVVRDALIADYSRTVVAREAEAIRIEVFGSSVIPGLLQTEAFARELLRAGLPRESSAEIDARVAAHMKRKRILEGKTPPLYWAVLDEVVLMRSVAQKGAAREQLSALLTASEHPHITLQIYPLANGLHSMQGGSLTMLTLRDGQRVGLVESFGSGEPVESPLRLVEYAQLFDMAKLNALSKQDSRKLVSRYLEETRDD